MDMNKTKPDGQKERLKIAVMGILLVISCIETYYFHKILGTGRVFSHFFYIPIILSALWWKRKGLWVAVFLAVLLIISHDFLREDVMAANDYLRAVMFIVISSVVAILSEKVTKNITEREKTERDLKKRMKELQGLYDLGTLSREAKDLEELFAKLMKDIIPQSMRFPDKTYVTIEFDGKEYFSEERYGYNNAPSLSAPIIVKEEKRGILTIDHTENLPFKEEFEQRLINGYAERLGKIIERKDAEEELRNSEKRFRDLVESSLAGIFIIQDDQIVYQNPEQEKVSGLSRSFNPLDFKIIHPDDVEKVKQLYRKIISREVRTMDTDFRFYPHGKMDRKHDIKWVQCRANLIEYQGKEAMLVNIMDITRSKEMEHLLRMQDKMSSLGRVAAGIAHEIRNPLSGINIYLSNLEKIYDKGEGSDKAKKIIGQLQSASTKIESVIRRVMDFSKPGEPKFVLTDINQPIEDSLHLSSVTLRKGGIIVEKDLSEDILQCSIDQHLITQVILNLITNAAEAMKNMEGVKKIGLVSYMENNRITIKVSDSGPGVPFNLRDKIFDPFYTTKDYSTGIGLSLCQRIVADHGGSLSVFASKWGGAEFVIEIPIERE